VRVIIMILISILNVLILNLIINSKTT